MTTNHFATVLATALFIGSAATAAAEDRPGTMITMEELCQKIRPFQRNGQIDLSIGEGSSPGFAPVEKEHTLYNVPDGFLLVIDTVTVKTSHYRTTGVRVWVTTTVNGQPTTHFLTVDKQLELPNDTGYSIGTHPVRLYADPGTPVVWGFYSENHSFNSSATISVSGQLVCN